MPPVPKPQSAGRGDRRRTLVIVLAVAAVAVVALVAGSLLLTRGGDGSKALETDSLAIVAGIPQDGTVLGRPTARLTMEQFEDIQCPYCKAYTDDAFPTIVKEYVRTGKLRIDFRGLSFVGPDSEKALKIVLAAGKQDKLWEVVGLFYENQGEENTDWVTDTLIDGVLAQVPGLDAERVKRDAASKDIADELAASSAQAQIYGLTGTPSFYLTPEGGKPYEITVALTPEAFRPALDDALKG
jgi:protein-disulfide isomerase